MYLVESLPGQREEVVGVLVLSGGLLVQDALLEIAKALLNLLLNLIYNKIKSIKIIHLKTERSQKRKKKEENKK